MKESTDQFIEGSSSIEVDDEEIFNGGLCYFEQFTKIADLTYIDCINCGYSTTTKMHPLFVIRRCDNKKTRNQVTKDRKVKLPGIVEQLGNFGIAFMRHIVAGAKEASEEVILERLKICKKDTLYYSDGVCLKCGCHVNDKKGIEGLNKLAWEESKCPEKYW